MIRAAAIGLVLSSMADGASAQAWAPLPSSNPDTTAVGTRWPDGTGAVARCQGGRYQLLFTLSTPVLGPVLSVSTRYDDMEAYPNSWRMTPQGNATFARQPLALSESWIRGNTFHLTFPPDAERSFAPPANPEALEAVLAACGHRVDRDQPQQPMVITNPDWESRPDAWIMRRYWPVTAAYNNQGGRVVMTCIVTIEGRLEDCIVESETPAGYNFGTAAIALAEEFRMRPRTVNGQPVGESLVQIPISWVMAPRE